MHPKALSFNSFNYYDGVETKVKQWTRKFQIGNWSILKLKVILTCVFGRMLNMHMVLISFIHGEVRELRSHVSERCEVSALYLLPDWLHCQVLKCPLPEKSAVGSTACCHRLAAFVERIEPRTKARSCTGLDENMQLGLLQISLPFQNYNL